MSQRSEARVMSPAEPGREEEKSGRHTAISIVSPGKDERGEEKDQDRLRLLEVTGGENRTWHLAAVCDGVTPSPHAADAAEYVSGRVREMFEAGGLLRIAGGLKEMRLSLLAKPPEAGAGRPAPLKYQNSYQTTFVAVCVRRGALSPAGMISVKAVGCGDCALFIFGEDGGLYYNSLNLKSEEDCFKRALTFIPVLPDCYDEESGNVLFDFEEYPEGAHLLLCSDGLYDGFANFKELHGWLKEYRAELTDSALRDKCLDELHHNLKCLKEDDDISFIWLHPHGAQPAPGEKSAGRDSNVCSD